MHKEALTANGKTLWQNVQDAECWNAEVITPFESPWKRDAGIAVLRGNLAPNGAVIKPSAASPTLLKHTGRAVVFESPEEMHRAVEDEGLDVDETCVLVLKNCGPKGYPGMAEVGNLPLPKKLLAKGVRDMVRISDARMSGTAYGTVVLHVAPEAAVGGPLAAVQNGDVITLDVAARSLRLHVSDAELARRLAGWRPPPAHATRGYTKLYVDHVLQADRGADFDFLVGRKRRARRARQPLKVHGMAARALERPYRGVFPVAPTIFHDDGTLDLEGQRRCVDFMIDAGSHGICILANFSEQFSLTDDERERVMAAVLDHVAGRVPVIVTTTHFSTRVCAERSRRAQAAGASLVMIMPPYHGATVRVPEPAIVEFFAGVGAAISIPIMIQDAPVSGTALSADLLARLARQIPAVRYFKLEVPPVATKIAALIALGGRARRRSVGRRGRHHADGRPRGGRHGHDDGRRLSGRHPRDLRRVRRRPARGGRSRLRALAAPDQLRESPMRIRDREDPDEGRRRDPLGRSPVARATGAAAPARGATRDCTYARPARTPLGARGWIRSPRHSRGTEQS